MKLKKGILSLIIFIFSFLCISCGSVDSSRNIDIPKDGVVKASVFEDLMFDDDMLMFNGESEDISYQWLFLGSSITKPRDINLLLEFNDKNLDKVKDETKGDFIKEFSFKEKKAIKESPTISITYNEKINVESADIYKYNEETKKYDVVCGSSVESNEKTTFTFTVTDNIGKFFIVGKENKNNEETKTPNLNNNQNDNNATSDENSLQETENNYLTEQNVSNNEGKSTPKAKISTGERKEKDKYNTDPVPEGKQEPVEWQDVTADKSKVRHCTLSIRCDTLLKTENYEVAKSNGKAGMIPQDGVIYKKQTVEFYEGEFVFDVLLREVQKNNIHMEYSMTPIYNSNYIEGINNLYEFDGGELSGWMYKVNGWFPNYGCSRYLLNDGDVIEWVYTCDLGRDVGCEWLGDEEK